VQQDNTDIVSDREFINERIASLSGSIGAIYVGGNSDVEQKEKFDRVEDAVCAVRSALEEGIVAGAGLSLYYISQEITYGKNSNQDYVTAVMILKDALKVPLLQILDNAGLDFEKCYEKALNTKSKKISNFKGYDVKNERYGDMFKMGVIDPLKVTKTALRNSISVSTTILTTNAIVTHARVENNN